MNISESFLHNLLNLDILPLTDQPLDQGHLLLMFILNILPPHFVLSLISLHTIHPNTLYLIINLFLIPPLTILIPHLTMKMVLQASHIYWWPTQNVVALFLPKEPHPVLHIRQTTDLSQLLKYHMMTIWMKLLHLHQMVKQTFQKIILVHGSPLMMSPYYNGMANIKSFLLGRTIKLFTLMPTHVSFW